MSDDLFNDLLNDLSKRNVAAYTKSKQPFLQLRKKLMEALDEGRLILSVEHFRLQSPDIFEFGRATRDLWELWRTEVGKLRRAEKGWTSPGMADTQIRV